MEESMPFRKGIRQLLLAGLVATGAGCSDFGHLVPGAMVILDGGTVLVHARGDRVDGQLELRAGTTGLPLAVRFLDGRGNELRDPAYRLGVMSLEPAIAEWEQDSQNPFAGTLIPGTPGTTLLLVQWLHGRDAHKDREWPVTVTVRP
jgi:hypothetical protein